MHYSLNIILWVLGLIMVVGIMWRLLSLPIPCPSWLSWMVELDNPFSKVCRARSIIKNADVQPGMIIIDIGCGPGRVTIPAAHTIGSKGRIVAMDIQEGMIAKVRKKAQSENLENIIFLHGGLGEGLLQSNIYDRAFLVTVLGEIPDQNRALREVFQALKPGGILSITEIIFDPHYQRFNVLIKKAEEVGFEPNKSFTEWCAYTLLLQKPQE